MHKLAPTPPHNQVEHRTLHDGALLQIGHIAVRPASSHPGAIETSARHVLALPLAGVFSKHDGPRHAVLATPGHALFIQAEQPYRLGFPGAVGDRCLALRLSSDSLARVMPEAQSAQSGDGFDASIFAPHAPLPAHLMLARTRLYLCLRQGAVDALDAEEQGVLLLVASLRAAQRQPARRVAGRSGGASRVRQVRRTQEAVWTQPQRAWTLADLATQACVSASHLAHAFRAETGSTVHGYVLRARLARALDAVLDSDAALTTVALDAGFCSHSHFSARFHAFFGHTPSALRRGISRTVVRELRKNMTALQPGAA